MLACPSVLTASLSGTPFSANSVPYEWRSKSQVVRIIPSRLLIGRSQRFRGFVADRSLAGLAREHEVLVHCVRELLLILAQFLHELLGNTDWAGASWVFGKSNFPSYQQQPAIPLRQPSHPSALTKELGPPHFIEGCVGMLEEVELFVNQAAGRRPLCQAEPVGLPHVQAGRLDPVPLFPAQLGAEELIQRLLLPLSSEP